ncbi:MAG TPA: hypothetical protein DCF45_03565 [Gammaproteobacteria bacterium]|nr:hypothetical protein [Gammaproteobacteria bacterium]
MCRLRPLYHLVPSGNRYYRTGAQIWRRERDLSSIADFTAHHPIWQELSANQQQALTSLLVQRRYEAEQPLIWQGEKADRLLLIGEGRVEIRIAGTGIGKVALETIGPGESLGWSWYSPPYLWQFDGVALEPVETFELEAEPLRELMVQDCEIGCAVLREIVHTLSHRLSASRMQLLDLYATP